MIRATKVLSRGSWHEPAADTVVLDFDQRHRRRFGMTGRNGTDFLLDLPEAVALRHGDGLSLEDGRIIAVEAEPEPLAEIAAEDALHLLRLAWHIGNRHLPAQISEDRLLIRRDHVIEEMIIGLGGKVAHVEAPFDPEGGAYAHGGHGHPDHHDHADHSHGHGHHHHGHG